MDPMPNISESDIPQVNVSPSVPVKHGNSLLKILIGLVLLGIGVGIGLFLANTKVKIPFLSEQVITTYEECVKTKGSTVQESYPATCVTRDGTRFTQPLTDEEKQNLQPPDSTADWKIYTNSQYNFSFKYPEKLEVQRATGNDLFFARDPDFSGGVGSLIPLSLALSVGNNLDKSPTNSWIDQLIETRSLNVSGITINKKIYKGAAAEGSIAHVLIAGMQKDAQSYFFEFSFTTDGCLSPDQEKSACEEKNKKFIDDNFQTIDQILSTFKFLGN